MPLYSTHQLAERNGVKLVVYGKSGTGKTSLIRTALNWNPVVVDCEAGTRSILDTGCAVWPVRNLKDFEDYISWVKGSQEARKFGLHSIDTMTEIAEQIVAYELPLAGKEPRRAYNILLARVTALFRDLRDLAGAHVLFLAQESKFKDEATGAFLYGADFPGGKLSSKAPRFVDEVLQLFIMNNPDGSSARALRCQPSAQHDAKDRSGLLAPLEYPDLGYIIHKLSGVQ